MSSKCQSCNEKAIYGFNEIYTHCEAHADKKMTRKSIRKAAACIKCWDSGIFTQYGVFGMKNSYRYCADHKTDDMKNVNVKSCNAPTCETLPNYAFKGKKAIRCEQHIDKGMVNVNVKLCRELNCTVQPVFGFKNTRPTKCKDHRDDGMINVQCKRCSEPNCTDRALYGIKSCVKCFEHKTDDMVYLNGTRCKIPTCYKSANFGLEGKSASRCWEHKDDGMINVNAYVCVMVGCTTHIIHTYGDYCFRCYCMIYPDSLVLRSLRVKEFAVVNALKAEFTGDPLIHNKRIVGGESKHRPDVYYDCDTYAIIIEIDEDHHNDYKNDDLRTLTLAKDAKKSIIMIRFNPDSYREGKTRVPSCWKDNKIVDETIWQSRLIKLFEVLDQLFISPKPVEPITTIRMFYNC